MKMLLLAAWLLAIVYPGPNATKQEAPTPSKQTSTKLLLRFKDFKTGSFYAGKPAKIKYKSHVIARQYRTVITEGYREGGVNFGGHYRFIQWGCGAPCVQSALVDLRTGHVYEGPMAPTGFDFKVNSFLALSNLPDNELTVVYQLTTEYWVWSEARHKFEQRFPRH